jgi:hypothetical protein
MVSAMKMPETPVAVAFRKIEPTWRNYVYYVERAADNGDENMKKFLAVYKALPAKEKLSIMPEQICDMAGIQVRELIGPVSVEIWSHHQTESVITASINHPKMIEATANYGQIRPDNNKDRELFFRMTGNLPDKKGASVVINNNPQTANITQSSAGTNGYKPMEHRVTEIGRLLDLPVEAVPIFQKGPVRVFQEDNQPDN